MKNGTVVILHGWAGGNWHTKHFASDLKKSEFKITDQAESATVLLAHSVGCYNLPDNPKAKTNNNDWASLLAK